MSRSKNSRGLVVVILGVIFVYSLLPLGTSLQFGGDEGYELMTGLLMSKGYVLYKQIWNDQPPLLVLLLSWLFGAFGPSMLAARGLAAGFGLMLFVAFHQVVKFKLGELPAILGTFFLLASPAVLEISVSVMQEAPAFALSLTSLWLLFQWSRRRSAVWLLASGLVLGLALEIKLTPALFVPAMLMEIAAQFDYREPGALRILRSTLLLWAMATVLAFGIIAVIWGQGSFQIAYHSHFTDHAIAGMQSPDEFPMPIGLFINHAEVIVASVVGLILVFLQQRWRQCIFPITALFTVLAVHSVHRPWWDYYYLHLAIPIAWLAGLTASDMIQKTFALLSNRQVRLGRNKWKGVMLFSLVAIILIRSEKRLTAGAQDLRARVRIDADPILAKMKENAKRTRWVYVQFGSECYPFAAGLLMPPQLALITPKRYWSDQINDDQIREVCAHYEVEQILLKRDAINDAWADFLKTNYTIEYQDQKWVLFKNAPERTWTK